MIAQHLILYKGITTSHDQLAVRSRQVCRQKSANVSETTVVHGPLREKLVSLVPFLATYSLPDQTTSVYLSIEMLEPTFKMRTQIL